MKTKILAFCILIAFSAVASGCAVSFYRTNPRDKLEIRELKSEVEKLEAMKAQEAARLKEAMEDLKRRLRKEIDDKQVRLNMAERGLVITFVAEVLFDSGKAKIRDEAHSVLGKVAKVIKSKAYDKEVGIEGHTDNVPIKYSGWKSNWELSTARATSVLHYLIEEGGLKAEKLSAIGYGEYRPVAGNDTEEGRQMNRRVEIVILPKTIEKMKAEILEEDARIQRGMK